MTRFPSLRPKCPTLDAGVRTPRMVLATAAVAALLLASPPALIAQGANAPPTDSRSAEVDRLFERWHRPDSPGAAVLVLQDGKVVHARGYGMANLEHGVPIRPGSVFDIASISKQFGAFAVALLEADGLLSLDDDVRSHIPELPDFGSVITLRHLVHHTSGVRDWPGTLTMAGWNYQDVMSFEQILRMAYHQRDLNFQPGAEFAYSNTGYNLLAEVVARVSGMSFRDFCDERIFRPRGMTRTHFHDDHNEIVQDRAESYRPGPDGKYRHIVNSLTALGSSSLFTTVEDLAKWVVSFEDTVDSPAGGPMVMARMHERGVLNNGDTLVYAWGQNKGEYRGLERWNHGGSWAGYRTHLMRFPNQRTAIIVLANTSEINAQALVHQITDLYLADVLLPPVVAARSTGGEGEGAAEAWEPDAGELSAYVGGFRSEELLTSYRLEVRDGTLVARHFRTGDWTFRPIAPDHFQAAGFGEVRFVRNASGAVVAFTANQARIMGLRFERVP